MRFLVFGERERENNVSATRGIFIFSTKRRANVSQKRNVPLYFGRKLRCGLHYTLLKSLRFVLYEKNLEIKLLPFKEFEDNSYNLLKIIYTLE